MTVRKKRRPRHSYANLYKLLRLSKPWIAVLDASPRPLEVLQVMLIARSVSTAVEIRESIDDLTDALLDVVGEEMGETGELVTVQ